MRVLLAGAATSFVSVVALVAGLAHPVSAGSSSDPTTSVGESLPTPAAAVPTPPTPPALDVRVIEDQYRLPWDVRELPSGALLVSERINARITTIVEGKRRKVEFPSETVWVAEETGLMGLAVDPQFERNRRVYTCQGSIEPTTGLPDVRVISWHLEKRRMRHPRVLVSGIPATNGGHGGCRLLVDERSGALLVTTGDGRIPGNAHNLDTLGGKVLRLNRFSGLPWPNNRWYAEGGARAYVFSLGHRNPQGIAQQDDGSLWEVEHGTFRDDEVNLLRNGGDYGWAPSNPLLYDDAPVMTDYTLPGKQIGARWRSGSPTVAPSGATFVSGEEWGPLEGTLAVANLKGRQLLFLRFDSTKHLKWVVAPPELTAFGRLRSVLQRSNGDLIVITSNGGNDKILRVRPADVR